MLRVRIILPKRAEAVYRNLDIIHDALVNGLTQAGAPGRLVTGIEAHPWNFAALGWRSQGENHAHTLVVTTPDPFLSQILNRVRPWDIRQARSFTSESVDFSKAEISLENDPIAPNQSALGIVMLSPLAISLSNKKTIGRRWNNDLAAFNLSNAINKGLSRVAGRNVGLTVQPDWLYLRTHPKHDVLVRTKEGPKGQKAFVIGMKAPLVIIGTEHDLRLAWYAGIGEKTRNGFGCIGLAEKGIGR